MRRRNRFGGVKALRRCALIGAAAGALSLSSPSFGEEPPTTEIPHAEKSAAAESSAHAPAPEVAAEGAAHEGAAKGAAHEGGAEGSAHEGAAKGAAHEGGAEGSAHEGAGHGGHAAAGHAGAEHGAEHGEHKVIENWWSWDYGPTAKDPAHRHLPPPFGFAIVNFFIFAGIMMKLAGKPLREMVRGRHDQIRKDLDEASKLRKLAAAKLEEYGKKVKDVEAEIAALIAQIRKQAEADKARIIAAAEEQARKIKADADRQIQAEIARAAAELKHDVIVAAVASAEEILKKQIGADDQRKMAEKYVNEVERAGRPS